MMGKRVQLAVLVLAIASVVRLHGIGVPNLWLDECVTVGTSGLDIAGLLHQTAADVHPPAHYLLTKYWAAAVGDRPDALRLSSALLSVVTVFLTFYIGSRVSGFAVGLLAALLLAVSPYQVYYAQELRMYPLATVLCLGAAASYLVLRPGQERARRLPPRCVVLAGIGFVLFSAAALYSHYFMAFVLIALGLDFAALLIASRREAVWSPLGITGFLAMATAIVILMIPWLLYAAHDYQPQPWLSWRKRIGLVSGLEEIRQWAFQITIGYGINLTNFVSSVTDFFEHPGSPGSQSFLLHRVFAFTGIPITIMLLVRGCRDLWRRQETLIACLFLIPFALTISVMTLTQSQMQLSRYLLPSSPFLFIIVAVGLLSLKLPQGLAAGAALFLSMILALGSYYSRTSRDSDYRPVVQILKDRYAKGDVIVPNPPYMEQCLDYYSRYYGAEELRDLTINTDVQQPAVDASGRMWLVLDYRSPEFGYNHAELEKAHPDFRVVEERMMPEESPKIRMILLRHAG